MTEQELNKKLAEWAGMPLKPIDFGLPCNEGGYEPPNFTQSLDACFKWLVPKVDYADVSCHKEYFCGAIGVASNNGKHSGLVMEETPALALCLAIEKVIDV